MIETYLAVCSVLRKWNGCILYRRKSKENKTQNNNNKKYFSSRDKKANQIICMRHCIQGTTRQRYRSSHEIIYDEHLLLNLAGWQTKKNCEKERKRRKLQHSDGIKAKQQTTEQ